MFCGSCGKEVRETSSFCQNCGSKTGSAGKSADWGDAPPEQTPPAQPEPQVFPEGEAAGLAVDEKYCFSCGAVIKKAAEICPKCGVRVMRAGSPRQAADYPPGYVPKSMIAALLLCLFIPGGHRFYAGKIGTGILMILVLILTFGIGYFIWWIIDLVSICTGKFADKRGYALQRD